MKLYRLSPELREELKKPLGRLILDRDFPPDDVLSLLRRGGLIVSVGDATTERLIKLGFTPSIQIVDGREMRIDRQHPEGSCETVLKVWNPAGFISEDALNKIAGAFHVKHPVRLMVDGEEDLLALPAIALSPPGCLILYGQPSEGVVVIMVDECIKAKAARMLKEMRVEAFSGSVKG